jgi:hypothetical protein
MALLSFQAQRDLVHGLRYQNVAICGVQCLSHHGEIAK